MTTQTVTAHVPKDLVSKVDAMAALLDRPRGWAVKEALADWVAVQEERELLTRQAMESVNRGIGIPHEEMSIWANSLGTDNPLPPPGPRNLK